MQSYPVSDIFNPNRHLPHPTTSKRCLDFQKSSEIGDHMHPLLKAFSYNMIDGVSLFLKISVYEPGKLQFMKISCL